MTSFEFNSRMIGMTTNLQRYATRLTGDPDMAMDLVQDTYLKALKFRDNFVEFTNLKAWIFTILKNTFINNYRHNLKENTIMDGTRDLFYINLPYDKGYISPESNYIAEEIEKEIDKLSNKFRIPFRMHLDGYKYHEIADKLGLNIGTVKSRIFLTRQILMSRLKDYLG